MRRHYSLILIVCLLIGIGSPLKGIHSQDLYLGLQSYSLISGGFVSFDTQGNYSYAATGYGVKIFDVTDPSAPQEIGNIATSGITKSATISGDYLYVCDFGTGLIVYDVSDVYNPVRLGSIPVDGSIRHACPFGNYVYITTETTGMKIVDCTDPLNLQLVNSIYTGGETFEITINDPWLYITMGAAGVGVYNISDPVNPTFQMIWNTTGGKSFSIHMFPGNETMALADLQHGVYLMDLSFPWIPTWFATISMPGYPVSHVTGIGDYGYLTYRDHGMQSFTSTGTVLDYLDMGWGTQGLYSIGDHVYVVDADSGLKIINCDDPDSLYMESIFRTFSTVIQVRVIGNTAYIANQLDGLTVMDVTDRSNPVFIESNPTGFWAKDVLITPDSSYIYVADFFHGLNVFSLANPLHPLLVNTVSTIPDSGAHAFAYRDGYLYLANYNQGLNVFDVSNPVNPVMVFHSTDTTRYYRELAISEDGQHLYACAETNGLLVYTIHSPDNIEYEYTITNLYQPQDIVINGNYAYVAAWEKGLYVLDITNYNYVFKVDSLQSPDAAWGVSLVNNSILALTNFSAGVSTVNISDPTNIYMIDTEDTPGYSLNANAFGNYLYLADQYDLSIFSLSTNGIITNPNHPIPDESLVLSPAYPNPFNPTTSLSFSLRQPAKVKLSIYDASGREVVVLTQGDFAAGAHRVTFNADGLASGIYFASIRSEGMEKVQKILYLK